MMLRAENFDDAYDESIKKIWNDFDEWMSNGSAWILERVEILYLNASRYYPIYGRSYIKTPKAIFKKDGCGKCTEQK